MKNHNLKSELLPEEDRQEIKKKSVGLLRKIGNYLWAKIETFAYFMAGIVPKIIKYVKDKYSAFKSYMYKNFPDLMKFATLEWGKLAIWETGFQKKVKTYFVEKHPGILKFVEGVWSKIKKIFNAIRGWFSRRNKTQKRFIGAFVGLCVLAFMAYRVFFFIEMSKIPVGYVYPTKETVPVYATYIGNTEAIKTMDIKARVEGFLLKRYFIEGSDVKKGALMFEIDPKPFQVDLESAIAQAAKDKAAYDFAKNQVKRYKPLVEKEYITQEDFDNYVTQMDEAAAALKASEANVAQAELNLGYCKMYAPFDGRIGKTLVNEGNLVGAGGQDTKLATIVQLDPIYAYFSPSDEDIHKILKVSNEDKISAELEFSDGTKYEHKGKLDFINNMVDQSTSTVNMRAIFSNQEKTLLPGQYVNVHLYLSEVPNTLLIPQKAIASDQGGEYVMVVGKGDKVEEKYITSGSNYKNMRTIVKGLDENDKVILNMLQLLKPGMTVYAMPQDKFEKVMK